VGRQNKGKQSRNGNNNLRTVDEIKSYINGSFGYPAYIKPLNGSQGSGIHKLVSDEQLPDIINEYEIAKVRAAIVEIAINYPDYRLVVLNDELISAYQRIPLHIVGDGKNTIRRLLRFTQNEQILVGRDKAVDVNDPRIADFLTRSQLTFDTVLEDGKVQNLREISNLSAGGTSKDFTNSIDKTWVEIAIRAAKIMNLNFAGVDLACPNIENASEDYAIIEVKAAPGLDHYVTTGKAQEDIVKGLYAKVFNSIPKI
jgi:D-alanine-D-alanine ligase-like ATP-grasp enzyme